jgi:putative glycosyltransferase (TIGR04348 family)
MRILLITPAPQHSRKGNRITAVRWAHLLRELGHDVVVQEQYDCRPCDVLVALHARRSFPSIARFRHRYPDRPLVVALTGTDLYGDIQTSEQAQQSLELATHLVLLQPMGRVELPEPVREKAVVIYQSVAPTPGGVSRSRRHFEVCVLGHLREVKDPFRTALAARRLPTVSRVRVRHVGGALSAEMEAAARAEEADNPRYRWLGELPRWRARRTLASSHLLVLSSHSEGGANVISEAAVDGVPILASRIPGSVGLLGEEYPGYFPVGDTDELARLLRHAEVDSAYYAELQQRCARLAPLFDPARESASWASLLQDLRSGSTSTNATDCAA